MHMKITPAPKTATCTIHVALGTECGKPAVITLTSTRGGVYHECADHAAPSDVAAATAPPAPAAPAAHPKTATSKPFVLVASGEIVGYADSRGPLVVKRAARLGAEIVRVQR
jgi:hypothetical protein